jgi:hypothetical protein
MPYKNPEKQRQYQREYNKKRRGGLIKKTATHKTRVMTAEDLRVLLEEVVETVRQARDDLELEAWARILLKGIEVGIKIVEVTDIDRRLTALEERAHEPLCAV